jgi:hypothetical protein
MDENFKDWFTERELKAYRALPYLVVWGIWLAWNAIIFKDQLLLLFRSQPRY